MKNSKVLIARLMGIGTALVVFVGAIVLLLPVISLGLVVWDCRWSFVVVLAWALLPHFFVHSAVI